MEELCRLTATEAAAQIRAGALSPVDLVEACLARIDALELDASPVLLVDARSESGWTLTEAARVLREAQDRPAET